MSRYTETRRRMARLRRALRLLAREPLDVVCPYCFVDAGKPCETTKGARLSVPHVDRIVRHDVAVRKRELEEEADAA